MIHLKLFFNKYICGINEKNIAMKRTDIATLGEFGLIKELTKNFVPLSSTIRSVGDDCAIITPAEGKKMLITTDFLVEGVHFDLSYTPLKHLGYKSVVVNLSDIYAMNGTPEHITVSVAISNRFSVEALAELYEGIELACQRYGIDLVGGDTTTSLKGLIISVTAIGSVAPEKAVCRNTAKVGDLVCVSGNLGAAYLGLQILMREKAVFEEDPNMQPELNENSEYLIRRILKPEARKDIIDFLSSQNILPHAMIDISDGLSSELFHICSQSNVGVVIEEEKIPIDVDTYNQAMQFQMDPTIPALNGGEDYELLFTMNKKHEQAIIDSGIDISIVGRVTEPSEGIKIKTRSGNLFDLQAQGWVSF
jgi:thiamine-monophosphate kinase